MASVRIQRGYLTAAVIAGLAIAAVGLGRPVIANADAQPGSMTVAATEVGLGIGDAMCVETIDGSPFGTTSVTRGCAASGSTSGASTPPPATPPAPVTPPPAPTTPPAPATPPPAVALPPGATNTGVPAGKRLTVRHGDLRITTAGTVIDGLDIRGKVVVEAPGVTIKNSIIRGSAAGYTSGSYLVVNWGHAGLSITDTEIAPTVRNSYVNGVVGNNYTLTRVNIHSVIDSSNIVGDNVAIRDSWLHDNLYYEQDPYWGGKPSHSDSIQIQNGTNIRLERNTIASGRNAGVMITQDRGPVSNLRFTGNSADGGACTINIAEKTYGPLHGIVITDNKFGRNTRHADCAIIAANTTKALMTVTNNFYMPDNAPVTVRRG